MNDQEQNIIVAEACGYRFVDEGWRYPNEEDWQKYKAVYRGDGFVGLCKPDWTQIPNYGQDLNAMRAAVLYLDISIHEKDVCLRDVFASEMEELLSKSRTEREVWCMFDLLTLDCSKVREAFIRTIGKWRDA